MSDYNKDILIGLLAAFILAMVTGGVILIIGALV